MRKAEILRHGLIENAKRVGKENLSVHGQGCAAAGAPCAAGEVPKSIYRDGDGFCEGTDVKGGRQMGHMVLNGMHFAAETLPKQMSLEQFRDALASLAVSQPVQNQSRIGTLRKKISELLA